MNLLQTFGRINSISPKGRKNLIWKICKFTKFQDRPFKIDFYGLSYEGHTKNHIDRYVYFMGAYEEGMLHFIKSLLEKSQDKIFIDIGANVGHHSLFASKFARQVYAFEPYEKVRASLESKTSTNKIDNITVIPFALGSEDMELSFYEPADFNTGTGSFVKDFKTTNQDNGLKLSVRNGSELFSKLGITSATVMKIDTEGFEALVLKGLLPFLEKTKPHIIMEYSPESERYFKEAPEVREFLERNYHLQMFDNPNKINFELCAWNFDKFGDAVLAPINSIT